MNKKAELFNHYLEEKTVTCFQQQELEDALHTVAFRSHIVVENQSLPTVILTDDSIYTIIRVQVASGVLNDGNKAALLEMVNNLNRQYKVFSYYFSQDGSLILDSCLVSTPDELNGDMVYTILNVIIKHFESEYKNIMKTIWA